jgi:hypothetical protein
MPDRGDSDQLSRRVEKIQGVKQRSTRDIPESDGLTGDDNWKPAKQAQPTPQERVRGGRTLE